MFSILIPTWNNLAFLKLCVEGIRKNSTQPHQIVVHVNDGSDGTLEWVKQQDLTFTHSNENVGICTAVNCATEVATGQYIVYMNDDMYPLPGWDAILLREISALPSDCFMLSATLIEPRNTNNRCVMVAGYGCNPAEFRVNDLLNEYAHLKKDDWSGSTWPPTVVHEKWWRKVGAYSESFSPGMSSDDDFAMKMWQAGCRIYKGVSASRVYHFISKSTGRVQRNDGRKQFLVKWHIKQSTFHNYYIRRGQPYRGVLKEPSLSPAYLAARLSGWIERKFS